MYSKMHTDTKLLLDTKPVFDVTGYPILLAAVPGNSPQPETELAVDMRSAKWCQASN